MEGRTSLTLAEGMAGMQENVFINIKNKSVTITADVEIPQGGMGTLYVDGRKVAEGRIERTQPLIFSADETADVGIDLGTPVVEAVGSEEKSRFTGKIPKVTVEIRNVNLQAETEVKKAWAEVRHKTE